MHTVKKDGDNWVVVRNNWKIVAQGIRWYSEACQIAEDLNEQLNKEDK